MVIKKIYKSSKDKIYNLSKKYSSFVGLDLPYFLGGGFWLSLTYITGLLKGFLLSIIFANYLSKDLFGKYSFFLSILGIAAVFTLPGLSSGITQAVAKGDEKTYLVALKKIFKWSFLGSFFLLFVALYEFYFKRFEFMYILLVLASMFPFYRIFNNYQYFLIGKKKFKLYSIFTSLFNILTLIFISLTIFYLENLFWLTFITILIQIIINGIFSFYCIKKVNKKSNVNEKSLTFGTKVSISNIILTFINNFDSLVIAYFLGFADLAIFKIVTLLSNQFKNLIKSFSPLILPKIVSENFDKKKISKHFFKFFLITIILILFYSLLTPIIFKYLYPKYYDYYWLAILFNLTFITSLATLPTNYLIKENKSDYINKVNIYSGLSFIFVSIILIYLLGLLGAILARIYYRLSYVLLSFYYFYK